MEIWNWGFGITCSASVSALVISVCGLILSLLLTDVKGRGSSYAAVADMEVV